MRTFQTLHDYDIQCCWLYVSHASGCMTLLKLQGQGSIRNYNKVKVYFELMEVLLTIDNASKNYVRHELTYSTEQKAHDELKFSPSLFQHKYLWWRKLHRKSRCRESCTESRTSSSIRGVVLAQRPDVSVNPIMFEEEPGGERTSKTIL